MISGQIRYIPSHIKLGPMFELKVDPTTSEEEVTDIEILSPPSFAQDGSSTDTLQEHQREICLICKAYSLWGTPRDYQLGGNKVVIVEEAVQAPCKNAVGRNLRCRTR